MVENKKKSNRIGEKHITNEGYEIEIIEHFIVNNYTIQFDDGTIIKNRQWVDIIKGNIKNPNHKSVHGVGYLGVGKYKSKNYPKTHRTWASMLQRCYGVRRQEKSPTYVGCSVDERWHNFQNFAKWHEENYVDGWQLDKDILFKGNKIYSPETCVFIPQSLNTFFTNRKNDRGLCAIGVDFYKRLNKFHAKCNINGKSKNLGYFNTEEEAFQAYKKFKEDLAKETAEDYKYNSRLYKALMEYTVEITD